MKRELWGIVSAVETDRDYIIGMEVIIETDCLPILGMISGCATPDIACVGLHISNLLTRRSVM